jgi:hypothetical protein
MNTKLSKKTAAWSLYQVLGLVMILSMLFAAPLAVMAWTVPEPPDQEPGGIVTIKVGDSFEGQYDKTLPVEVTVTSGPVSSAYPEGYKPPCVPVGWGVDGIWTCEIQLDPDEAVSVGEYTYMVKQGDVVEYGTFTDAAPPKVGSLNHCDPPTPYDQATYTCAGTGNIGWTSGANDGIYYEGDAIPYRAYFQNLVIGNEYWYEMEWDTTKSSKHALDYITSYNYTVLQADPCIGLFCSGAPHDTIAIPEDTFMTSHPDWMGTQAPGVFSMWGGEFDMTGPYTTPGNYIGDTSTSIKVYFTATQTEAVIAWGGHISERANWGPDNSAVFIPGKPFHMRSKGFFDITNNTSRSSGSTDLALDSTGVIYPAKVTIVKEVIPLANTSPEWFYFTGSFGPFQLRDYTDPTEKEITFTVLDFGQKTITETVPTGWDLKTISCVQSVVGAEGSVISVVPPSAVIDVQEASMWTCTFNNELQLGSLTLRKTVDNTNGGTLTKADFPVYIGSDLKAWDTKYDLLAGSYTVSETSQPGYTASVWGGDCAADGTVIIEPGVDKECTITNTAQPAYVTLTKVVTNNSGGSAMPNDFNLRLKPTVGADIPMLSGVQLQVMPGTYQALEDLVSGYAFVGFTGDCDTNGYITVGLGQSKSCTLTNDDIQSYVTVNKVVQNNYGGTAGVNDFQLKVGATGVNSGQALPVNPGTYVISETLVAGYEFVSISGNCYMDSGTIKVDVALGQSRTCTITNRDIQPKLYVIKVVVGGTAVPADFMMHVTGTNVSPANFPGAGAPGTLVTLNQGTYLVTETVDPMYSVSYSADCGGTIYVGQTKTCTVTNTLKVPGWTPGFWKNHGPGAPHGKDAWQYTAFMPGDLLDDVFELGMVAGLPVKGSSTGFIDKTLMEALGFRGGGGEAGAAEILLRAGVASLLNASFVENYGHPTIPNLVFPMTVDEVIEAVNEALDSFDRYEMLTLAAELDMLNNGSWEFPWHLLP